MWPGTKLTKLAAISGSSAVCKMGLFIVFKLLFECSETFMDGFNQRFDINLLAFERVLLAC